MYTECSSVLAISSSLSAGDPPSGAQPFTPNLVRTHAYVSTNN